MATDEGMKNLLNIKIKKIIMKTWLILSAILLFPFILFSMAIGVVIIVNPAFFGKDLDMSVLLIYTCILGISVAVIALTTIQMIKYAPNIGKLEEATECLRVEKLNLSRVIEKYNELISNQR